MQARKEVRLAHYERFMGSSFTLGAGVEESPFVDLCVFPPNPLKGRNYYTLATDGLSDLSLFSPSGRATFPAVEVLAYTESVSGEAFSVRFMQALARAMADPGWNWTEGRPVNALDIDPAIPADARARHLMLLPPVREWPGFEVRRYTNGSEVRFLWAALLAVPEWKAAQAGREDILARLKSADPPPFLDPTRPSLI
jgi:hypothetical protein